jgi:3-isopropylmalate/(R)-2-methylmalate dehydratase large subunit
MSIELGARFGTIAPDDTTFDYLADRPHVPRGADWETALSQWRTLRTDDEAAFARVIELDVTGLKPQITWGTTPGDVVAVDGVVPSGRADALAYMGLQPGQRLDQTPIDYVFIGSCTNSRLSDLRAAADLIRGRKVAAGVRALVVPGSTAVRAAAQREGLHRAFAEAGFEWREAGCSMCLGINDDVVPPGKRCVSTSNRNFEGRQGPGARTHLASPLTAAASAIAGRIADPTRLWSP